MLLALFSLTESKQKDFYTFKVVNSRGKLVSLEKYRGAVSLGGLTAEQSTFCIPVMLQPLHVMNDCCMHMFVFAASEHVLE